MASPAPGTGAAGCEARRCRSCVSRARTRKTALPSRFRHCDRRHRSRRGRFFRSKEDFPMKSSELDGATVLVFDKGDEVVSTLTAFAKEHHIAGGHFTAIGAFSDAEIGYFDLDKKDYLRNPVKEQVEVVSLIGD